MAFATVADVKKEVLSRCGELTDGTSEYETIVNNYIDYMHKCTMAGATEFNVEVGDPWTWARAQYPGVINMDPFVQLTVTVNNASVNCSFSVAPVVSYVGWMLKIEGRAEFFRIVTHTAGQQAFTIDAAYTDNTGTLPATLYHLEYNISNVLRLCGPMRTYRRQSPFADDTGQIDGIDRMSLDRDYPLHRILQGIPDRFAIVYQDNAGTQRVKFNRIPFYTTRVEYDYIPVPATLVDASVPLLPEEHRIILVYGACYYLMVDKNDNRAAEYKALTVAGLEALIQSERRMKENLQKDMGRLIPRRDLTNYTRRYYSQEVSN